MNSTQTRERGGLRLWLLLITIGVALVAALGFAKPAWADESITVDQFNQRIASQEGETATFTQSITISGGGTIDLAGKTVSFTKPAQLIIPGSTEGNVAVTISGPGTLTGESGQGLLVVGKNAQDGSTSAILTIGSGVAVENPSNRAIVITGGSDVTIATGANVKGGGLVLAPAGKNQFQSIFYGAIQLGGPTGMFDNSYKGGTVTVEGNVTGNYSYGAISVFDGDCVIEDTATVVGGSTDDPTLGGYAAIQVGYGYQVESAAAQGLNATLTINGGTVRNAAIDEGGATYAGPAISVFANNTGAISDVTINDGSTIEGGSETVAGKSMPAITVGQKDPVGTNKVTVNGGTITNTGGGISISTAGNQDTIVVNDGVITGTIANNGDGAVVVSGGDIQGNIYSSSGGTVAVSGGSISGKLENTGTGTATWTGGDVAGGTSGDVNVVPPETTPGSPEAVTGTVSGVVGPVAKEMAPYGTVTVSSDTYTWDVDITAPDTPLATVAGVLVSPVVNAVGAAGATYAESVQNGQINIGLPAAPASVNAFATLVLQDAVANLVTTSLDSTATLGDLDGMTAGIRVTTNTGSLVYTFNFGEGVTPTPPAPQGDVTVYRLYNKWEGTHLYTTDVDEVKANVKLGWTNEGPYWYAPAAGTDAASYLIVRLYNPYNSGHYYVPASDTAQIRYLTGLGWVEDSAAASFWSAAAGTDCPVYTLFNPYNTVDTHLYTPKSSEVADLTALGWVEQTTVIYAASLPAEE